MMAGLLGLDSAIGWAHWRLRSGIKVPLIAGGCYAVILIIAIVGSVHSDPPRENEILQVWRSILLAVQAVILILIGAARVSSALRTDITLRLIESHRMMPISPYSAVSGYLWGTNALTVTLGLVALLIGAVVTRAAGMDVTTWLVANAVIFSFAVFSWVVAAFGASLARSVGVLVFVGLMVAFVGQGAALVVAPPAALLIGPMLARSVFAPTFHPEAHRGVLVASTLAQLAVGSVLYIGVARKYRRSDESALAVVPALSLLVIWVGLALGVIANGEALKPDYFGRINYSAVLCGALISSMLIALIPISNAIKFSAGRLIGPMIAIACAAAICVLFCAADLPAKRFFPKVGQAAVVLVAYCLGLCSFVSLVNFMHRRRNLLLAVWIFGTWMVPLVIDYALWATSDTRIYQPTEITSFSPIGALMLLFSNASVQPTLGIAFQAVICLLLSALLFINRPKLRYSAAADDAAALS